jgi:hypothetical protein
MVAAVQRPVALWLPALHRLRERETIEGWFPRYAGCVSEIRSRWQGLLLFILLQLTKKCQAGSPG